MKSAGLFFSRTVAAQSLVCGLVIRSKRRLGAWMIGDLPRKAGMFLPCAAIFSARRVRRNSSLHQTLRLRRSCDSLKPNQIWDLPGIGHPDCPLKEITMLEPESSTSKPVLSPKPQAQLPTTVPFAKGTVWPNPGASAGLLVGHGRSIYR